ncbi:MAG: hypothetical protein HUJ81_03465 [Acidaminococcus fermentans]|uniref:hypothetical protein n=1 Tax=Acidaminococcus fermentans TaxID=905 RepID=UPI002432F725|nr:hypothetical protein [Acidaminococcus fermentans]MCF0139147.1 hypothetical protein [Acidaminococcus fermentans]
MKILRSLLLTAILAVSAAFTAFASPEAPTDQEVIQAFQEANTVYEWFEHHPLKTDGKEEKDTGYMIYYTVADKNYPNMMALKTRVNECFTEALAGFIISDSRMYREFDGKLYVAPSAKALDPRKGTSTINIVRESPTRINLEVSTPIMEDPVHGKTNVVETRKTIFPYVKTLKGWRFSYFESLE